MWKSLKDLDVSQKTVLVRVDFNVPLDDQGRVTNVKRIRETLPTLRYLHEQGARTLLLTHLGRPNGEVVSDLTTDRLVKPLSELFAQEGIEATVDSVGALSGEEVQARITQLPEGGFLLLENTRFDVREKKNDPSLAQEWAQLADVYVNDGFAVSHRDHASVTGIAKLLPSAAGFSFETEVKTLAAAITSPRRPLHVVMGGVKMETRIPMIENFLENVGAEMILLGGAMANTFFVAQGHAVGMSLYEQEYVSIASTLLERCADRLVLPVDVVVADAIESDQTEVVSVDAIPSSKMVLDIGPQTLQTFAGVLSGAGTIIWNGPMGVFERDPFLAGTKGVAEVLASASADTIIGGGDTAAAVERVTLTDKMTFVSTGGGASLALFEGKPLPGIEALDEV
ncbi:MAG: phosphoglycerate kinase [Candidatus Andersenbacteria bacterium]|nr:phosphoglycerate kinase [Candidatus Andersenbacteria bacterium]